MIPEKVKKKEKESIYFPNKKVDRVNSYSIPFKLSKAT